MLDSYKRLLMSKPPLQAYHAEQFNGALIASYTRTSRRGPEKRNRRCPMQQSGVRKREDASVSYLRLPHAEGSTRHIVSLPKALCLRGSSACRIEVYFTGLHSSRCEKELDPVVKVDVIQVVLSEPSRKVKSPVDSPDLRQQLSGSNLASRRQLVSSRTQCSDHSVIADSTQLSACSG